MARNSRKCRSIDEWIEGSEGEDTSFRSRLSASLDYCANRGESSYSDDNGGKRAEILRIRITLQSPNGPVQECLNRDFRINGAADTIVSQVRESLHADPGDGCAGDLRAFFYPQGSGKAFTSYTAEMVPTGTPGQGATGDPQGSIPQARAALEGYIGPLIDRNVAAMDANTRMVQANAAVMGGIGQIVQGAATFLANRDGGGIFGKLLGSVLGGAAAAGVPGAGAAKAAVDTVQVAASALSPRDRLLPDGSPAPMPDPNAPTTPATTPPGAPPAGAPAGAPPAGAPGAPPKLTKADVERWARENPAEAKSMVVGQLRERGAPEMIVSMIESA